MRISSFNTRFFHSVVLQLLSHLPEVFTLPANSGGRYEVTSSGLQIREFIFTKAFSQSLKLQKLSVYGVTVGNNIWGHFARKID